MSLNDGAGEKRTVASGRVPKTLRPGQGVRTFGTVFDRQSLHEWRSDSHGCRSSICKPLNVELTLCTPFKTPSEEE